MLVFLFIIGGLLSLAWYSASFQTFLVQQYLKSLSKKLNTHISVETVEASFFNKVRLTNLYVEDLHQDTLAYIKELEVGIDEFALTDKKIILDKVLINECYFNLQKHKYEDVTNLQFIIDHFASNDTTKSNWQFGLNNVELKNTRFNYNNLNLVKAEEGIDYSHIGISGLYADLDKIRFINKGIDCKINSLTFLEQSGFKIDQFYAEANVAPTGIITQNLKINTPQSKIDGNVTFLTNNYGDLANFIDSVKIKSYFNNTHLNFKDISYFAPALNGLNKSIDFEGELKGRISNIQARKFSFITDDGTRFNGKVDISGLPNVEDMFMYVDIKDFSTTKEKVETMPAFPFTEGKFIELPRNFRHLGAIRFKGNFTGFYHDFVAYGKVKTSLGDLKTDISFKLKNGTPVYKGKIETNRFRLGQFMEIPKDIGAVTMNVNVDGKGFSINDIDATMVGDIKQIEVKGYNYTNVTVEGAFKKKIFTGFVSVQDENIAFDFDGSIDLANKIPAYHFISNIKEAKLAKLNMINSENPLKTRFSTQLTVDLVGDNIDNLVGEVKFLNSIYKDKLDSIEVDSVVMEIRNQGAERFIAVKSDILEANLKGELKLGELTTFIERFFVRYIPSQIDEKHQVANLSNDLDFGIEFHNTELLSKLLFKDIKLSDNTSVKGGYNATSHVLSLLVTSPNIEAYGATIKNLTLNSYADENKMELKIDALNILKTDSFYINNFRLHSNIENNTLITKTGWLNNDTLVQNEGNFEITTLFDGFYHVTNTFDNSYTLLSDMLWQINPNSFIEMDTTQLFFRGFSIASGTESILIDGRLSGSADDQLDLLLKKFDLTTINKIIPKEVLNVTGIIDGIASIRKENEALLFTSDLEVDDLRLNDYLIGNGNVVSTWNTKSEALKLKGEFKRDHIPTILFDGYYYPKEEDESLNINLSMYKTKLKMFAPYIDDYVALIDGEATANVSLTGNFKKPALNGKVGLTSAKFKVNYLNTTFKIDKCNIDIVPDMISFDNIKILDAKENKMLGWGVANGTIYHNWFADWSLDVGINANNFLVLNTTEKENSIYYGKANVSGFVNIDNGNKDKQMRLEANVKTEKNTTINIPLTDNEDITENSFITFVSKDSADVNLEAKNKVDLSGLEMNFDLEVTPDAEIRLIFDDQIGDVMRSTGSGNLKLNINNDGDLNMFGKYTVKDGDYLFTLQNVINKRFDLEEGGTIFWDGSPYDAEINLTAIYRLRARLYDLLANVDTSDVYKRRIPVDLKLNMRNAMMNPDISFDIVLPTADEDTKSKVRSVLYVSGKEENIQELNKQVFSLLVLNSFLPPSGADANYSRAGVGSTTSSELLSNQVSNMLSKISNDFDIGVNYRPGDELSNQELELALSTQIFNDRLVLDGNLGISDRQNVSGAAQNTSNLAGDISLEYKITKDGKLRVKAFNNSNQYSFQNINSPYTQGVGISYREEYDTNKEFWDNLLQRFGLRRKKKKNITEPVQ